ncbi:type IX secretion system PorP/SprF family membrane protein [Lacibacter cauensis]|uniref:Type IX secretion system PorP/SprF family membrane protein n=1 Tax=Lacibacter cauensis TaxID=510947 RepID=A0A562SIX5_9BACT|nr:PorP/SprF family type IX secretion system membrane protein [Lacibacter cauensis]TWI81239.1 type IX secretion system PorP/SprF family membrane protein [Lacibacter cauensis]
MRKLLLLPFLLIVLQTYAQDPNFSQFFASPLTLNPALTGKFNGTLRLAGNYRNQWPTINNAFRTSTLSADFGILGNTIPEFDQFGVGVMGMYDINGDGVMKNSFISGSVAYHKGLDENGYHQIGVGFSGTYVQRRLDLNKLDFQDELTSLGFTGNTAEIFGSTGFRNISYADVNAGFIYNGATNDYNNFYIGASVYHINRPKVSFLNAQYIMNPRFTVHGGGYFPIADATTLFVSANYQRQAAASEAIFGAAIGRTVNGDFTENPTDVYAGVWVRYGDAVIPYVGLEFGSYRFGFSYDVNTSRLAAASQRRGGMEISLIWTKKYVDPNKKKLNCPRF